MNHSHNSAHQRSWTFEHLCTRTDKLPDNFFNDSPFGKSLALPSRPDEQPVISKLAIQNFRALGFPKHFCQTLTTGVPLLINSEPPPTEVPNYSSVFEYATVARDTLRKWQEQQFYKEVQQRPHVVSPLGVVVRHDKHRLVLDATASGLMTVWQFRSSTCLHTEKL